MVPWDRRLNRAVFEVKKEVPARRRRSEVIPTEGFSRELNHSRKHEMTVFKRNSVVSNQPGQFSDTRGTHSGIVLLREECLAHSGYV